MLAHASAQHLAADEILARIDTDGEGPGSWSAEWVRAGETYERDGNLLAAATHYNLARFPFVDGPARAEALRRCVAVFDRWRRDRCRASSGWNWSCPTAGSAPGRPGCPAPSADQC